MFLNKNTYETCSEDVELWDEILEPQRSVNSEEYVL
jgi:hypothetical protein